MGGSWLDRTDDFQKFCGSGLDWIQFLRIRIGLGLKSFTVRSSLIYTRQQNEIQMPGQFRINLRKLIPNGFTNLCCWDKRQSADSNTIKFHRTLKCTKDQSSHFCVCFLVLKWIFQLRPLSDKISHRIRATTGVCRHKQLLLRDHQKQQHSWLCIWEILNAG